MIMKNGVLIENKVVKNLILISCELHCDNMGYVRHKESEISAPDVNVKVRRIANARIMVMNYEDNIETNSGKYRLCIINDDMLDDEYKSDDKIEEHYLPYGNGTEYMLEYGPEHHNTTPKTTEFVNSVLGITDNNVVATYIQDLRSYDEDGSRKVWIDSKINVSTDLETSLSILKGILSDTSLNILKDNLTELQNTPVIHKNEIDFNALYEKMSTNVKNHIEALEPSQELKSITQWNQDKEILLNRYVFEKEAFHAVDTYLKLVLDNIKNVDDETSQIVTTLNGCSYGSTYSLFDRSGLFKPLRLYPIKDCSLHMNYIIDAMESCNGLYVCTQYDSRNMDIFGGNPEITITNYRSIYKFIPHIIGETIGYDPKTFLDVYENANKFLNVLKSKLEKHINPGISLASCTIDNVSQFVKRRNIRIEILKGLIEIFDRYISICDEFRDKPYIPISIIRSQEGEFPYLIVSNLMNVISEKYYNEDMNSFINKILRLFEDMDVETMYQDLEYIGSGSWLAWLHHNTMYTDSNVVGKAMNRDFDSVKYWMIGNAVLHILHRSYISNINKDLLEDIKNKLNVEFRSNYLLQDQ